MKVIILAGGYGTRLAEYTQVIPKPMVPIGDKPMIWHIMNSYANYGHNDFYVALGYKGECIKEYFLKYQALNSDFTVDLSTGSLTPLNLDDVDWKVTLVNTGVNTMTGGRVKRLRKYISDETCMLTYGDGLSNINIDSLLAFHKEHKKLVTISAVRPQARFGRLELNGCNVQSFKEKPQLHDGWINGGFFVIDPDFFDLIDGDDVMLERIPLEKAAKLGELMAYKHDGYWQCMDTKRDCENLEKLWNSGKAPWKV